MEEREAAAQTCTFLMVVPMPASTATLWDCGYIFVVAFGMVYADLSSGIILLVLVLSKDMG